MGKQFITLLSIVVLAACNKTTNDSVQSSSDPRDLTIDITQNANNIGLVTIQGNAVNAVEYQLYPGIENNEDPLVDDKGTFTVEYPEFGVYSIEMRAYGADGRYIKKTQNIAVGSNEPVITEEGYSTPTSYPGMDLIWHDEFNGATLSSEFWSHDIGNGCPNLCGWGNNELEYYQPQNSWIEDGKFIIEARKETVETYFYTSSKVLTRDKFSFKYGRVDFRALLPKGQGIWPAMWMLGANHNSIGWPACGELDVMEMIGGSGRERTVYGNVYWDNNGVNDFVGSHSLDSGTFADKYHVFSVIWNEEAIEWYVDDILFHSFSITTEDRTEFHKPFFLIMNVAVGGIWPGIPDNSTQFPTRMYVDYVRVFQNQ